MIYLVKIMREEVFLTTATNKADALERVQRRDNDQTNRLSISGKYCTEVREIVDFVFPVEQEGA